ncbi:Transmembrane protein [Lachnellula suecica]|uniref:Transmembrane protein n=1 Tax=Lachnellula suecica TaxID=602035 RepID=A0A8T9CCW4_9HELO|nr:Transmembrane protein [Lachnellula suecica]
MFTSPVNFDIDQYLNRFVPRPRLHLFPKPISRFLGYRSEPPRPVGDVAKWAWACIGAFCGLLVVEAVYQSSGIKEFRTPVVIASLGAAAILEYNAIDSPFSQPRNAILGQLFSAVVGVGITKLFHLNPNFENLRWIAGALSVGVSSAIMGLTKTVYPPAGATALLAATTPDITALGWLLVPLILLGNILLLAVACVLNNIQRRFPLYWWTAADLSPPKEGDVEAEGKASTASSSFDGLEKQESCIFIDSSSVHVPAWVSLEEDEQLLLENLRVKIEGRLRLTGSQDTDTTQV